jgi:hypothetical protein
MRLSLPILYGCKVLQSGWRLPSLTFTFVLVISSVPRGFVTVQSGLDKVLYKKMVEGCHHSIIVIPDKDWMSSFLKITISNLSQPKLRYVQYND